MRISNTEYKYYSLFGQRTEGGIIEEMLEYSPILKANDVIYQSLLKAMANKDVEALKGHVVEPVNPIISGYMRTSLKTLKKHLPYI